MKKICKKLFPILLVAVMLICGLPFGGFTVESSAASFAQINAPEVFLTQPTGSVTCTLYAATMMMRRYSMLRGDSNWASITADKAYSVAWNEGKGLFYTFSYSSNYISNISVSHGYLPTGSANKEDLISLLKTHPEGVVIYYTNRHAVLLTDYTNGKFYCADPGKSASRIELSQAVSGVTLTSVGEYWYITSPRVYLTEVGPHVCDRGTWLYCGGTHPHNSYYQCSLCGSEWRDWDSSNYLESCQECSSMVNLGDGFFGVILNTKNWIPISNTNGIVDLQKEDGTAEQVWYFDRQDDGTYIISSASDGKVLEIEDGNTEENAQIIAKNDYIGKNFQRWRVYKQDNGYVLISAHHQRAVSLKGGSIDFDTKVTACTRDNTDAQIWSIYKGKDVQLESPVLTVDVGTSKQNTTFTWTETYGEIHFAFKIWKDVLWQGDAYYINSDADIGFGVTLPAGTYHAYVDACNYYTYIKSNTVTFTVKEQAEDPVFTVQYDANGGTKAPQPQKRVYGTNLVLTQEKPENKGLIFDGWNTKKDGSGICYFAGDVYSENTDVILYAQWKEIKFLELNNGYDLTISESDGYLYGTDLLGMSEEGLKSAFKNENVVITSIVEGRIGTGTKIQLIDNEEVVDEKVVVIIGDVNGDGQFDGQDAVFISCVVSGMLEQKDIGKGVHIAADCNFDDKIDEYDIEILVQAGLQKIIIQQM